MSDVQPGVCDAYLRDALCGEWPDFARPGAEVIDAFLLGTATARQRVAMRDALARSAAFRSEILELAEDLARLDDPSARGAFDAVLPSSPPPFALPLASRPEPGPFERLFGLIWSPALAYAIAAAFALALVLPAVSRRDAPRPVAAPSPIPAAPTPSPAPRARVRTPPAPPAPVVQEFIVEPERRTRGAAGRAAVVPRMVLRPGVRTVSLRLPIEDRAFGGDDADGYYGVTIEGPAGGPLRLARRGADLDANDGVLVVDVAARHFRAGRLYSMSVDFVRGGERLPVAEGRFEVGSPGREPPP